MNTFPLKHLLFLFCLVPLKMFAYDIVGDITIGYLTYHCVQPDYNPDRGANATIINCKKSAVTIEIPFYVDWNGRDNYVKHIESEAFKDCVNLTSVTTKASVSLGKRVFYNCPNLHKINISNGITSFGGDSAFYGSSITEPIQNNTIFFHLPSSTIGKYSLSHGITKIGAYAMQDCKQITEVILPSTIKIIDEYAFKNCTGLTSILIPESTREIAANAFSGCNNLRSVNASGSTDNMTWSLQDGSLVIKCTGVITSTPWSAFSSFIQEVQASGLDGSISWSLNNGVLTVAGLDSQIQQESSAPWYKLNSYITAVNATGNVNGKVWTLSDGVLSIRDLGSSIGYPWSIFKSFVNNITFENGVEAIAAKAFLYYTSLQSITLSPTVNTIGSKAFYGCTSLVSVIGGDGLLDVAVDAFPESAYYVENYIKYVGTYLMEATAKNLPSYTIKDSTKVVGTNAFKDCTRLTSITIPNSVKKINAYAFYDCTRLTMVTGMSNVTYIGDYCFCGCSALSSINLPSILSYIGNSAFNSCSSLSNIGTIFPNMLALENIGSYAFYGCSALPITNLSFGNSLKDIGEFAFNGCNIVSVEISCNVSNIGTQAFAVQTLKHVQWNARNSKIETEYNYGNLGPFVDYYQYHRNNTCSVESLEFGSNVKVIPGRLGYGMEKLTSITIPASVDSIGVAFDNTNNKLDTIIWDAKNCKSPLKQSTIPLRHMKDQIKLFVIGNNVESIPDYLCADMKNVSPISIPNSVKRIGRAAFRNSNVNKLSSNTEDIGVAAFKNCSGLPRSLTMPTKLVTMGDSAFIHCHISSIIFPSSLQHLGKYIFAEEYGFRSNISQMTCYSSIVPNITKQTFQGVSTDAIIYVKDSVVLDYMLDENWGKFDIRAITANTVLTDSVAVASGDQDVTLSWPVIDGASSYTIVIVKNGETVVTLNFGADGKLLNIAFAAPGHNGAHQAPAAMLTAQGYQFTVTGLNPGTAYNYSVTATDAGGKTLAEYKGNFNTTGGTGFESVHDAQCTPKGLMHKVLRNGQVLIETNNATYTPMGQKVK